MGDYHVYTFSYHFLSTQPFAVNDTFKIFSHNKKDIVSDLQKIGIKVV